MRTVSTIRRILVPVSLGLMLAATSGCIRFGSKPPARLLAISTDASLPAGQPTRMEAKSALYIETPAVVRAIDTPRVAVRDGAHAYAYVKKALWVDTPAHQFEALLRHTIHARAALLVLNPDEYPARSASVLHGELIAFGIDADSHTAIVTYDASLIAPDGTTISQQRFTASEPVAKIDGNSVAAPISEAANEVAAAVADWIRAQP